MGEESLVAGF